MKFSCSEKHQKIKECKGVEKFVFTFTVGHSSGALCPSECPVYS